MNENKIYFGNLDATRFIAATMVFLGHGISPAYAYLPIKNTFIERILLLISDGGTGVSIFFVLSGFLITYLLISEYQLNSTINLKNFYIRRVLRIWPLYFAVVFFSFLVYPFFKSLLGVSSFTQSNIWYHLTFLSNLDIIHIIKNFPGHDAMSQDITWSVSVEEQFYVFWPLIFALLPVRYWLGMIIFTIAVSLGFRIYHFNDKTVLYFHSLSVLLDLGIGGLFAYLVSKYKKIKSIFERTSTLSHVVLFVIAFCLLLFESDIFNFKFGHAVSRVFISLSFVLIICSQALTKSNSILNLGKLSFANKWGKYTYGIYLIHPIVITMLDLAVRYAGIPRNNFINVFTIGVVGFVLTLAVSWLSYEYFESRFLRLKEKFAIIKTAH